MFERLGIRTVVAQRRRPAAHAGVASGVHPGDTRARGRAARAWREMRTHLDRLPATSRIVTVCAHCGFAKTPAGEWVGMRAELREARRADPGAFDLSHGICPPCLTIHYAEFLVR